MQVYLILALIFAILVAAFAIQNTAVVTVHFLFWQGSISLVLVILGSVAAGALIFFVLGLIKQLSYNRERKELLRTNERLSAQLAEQKRELATAEEKGKEAFAVGVKAKDKQEQSTEKSGGDLRREEGSAGISTSADKANESDRA